MGIPSLTLALAVTAAGSGLSWPPAVAYPTGEAECPKPLSVAARSLLGFRVDDWNLLGAAEAVLGPSPDHNEGDAASHRRWRCWQAANGDGTILYVAKGEVEFILRLFGPEMSFPERGTCPKSTLVHRALATANGTRLGLTRALVEKKIGRASKVGEGWYERACFTQKAMTKKQAEALKTESYPFFTICSVFRVVEVAGRAVGIEIIWSETS